MKFDRIKYSVLPIPFTEFLYVWKSKMIQHPELIDLLKRAYSAEKAAAFAYIGHAQSVRNPEEKKAIRQIELDEWEHRQQVKIIMDEYQIEVSRLYEIKFHVIGKLISFSCFIIGWFMPYYFAGRLESGNVCEYFRMMHYFHSLGITKHDEVLYEMGMKEKEHEVYFLNGIKRHSWLNFFERIFRWGNKHGLNDVDLEKKYSLKESEKYCRKK